MPRNSRIHLPIVDFDLDMIMEAFPSLISDSEVNIASKWQSKTLALINGVDCPSSPRQTELLDVILGHKPAATRFEILWEKLVNAYLLLKQVSDLSQQLDEACSRIKNLESAFQRKHAQLVDFRKLSETSVDEYKSKITQAREDARSAKESSSLLKQGIEEAWFALCIFDINFESSVLPRDWEHFIKQWRHNKVRAIAKKDAELTDQDVAFLKLAKFGDLAAKDIEALYNRNLMSGLSDLSKDILEKEFESIEFIRAQRKSSELAVDRWSSCEACRRPISFCRCTE